MYIILIFRCLDEMKGDKDEIRYKYGIVLAFQERGNNEHSLKVGNVNIFFAASASPIQHLLCFSAGFSDYNADRTAFHRLRICQYGSGELPPRRQFPSIHAD